MAASPQLHAARPVALKDGIIIPHTPEDVLPHPSSRPSAFANGMMAAFFIFAAALEYNDPHPLRWMAIYLAAAAAFLLAVRRHLPWWLPVVIGLTALVWASTLIPHMLGHTGLGETAHALEMRDVRREEGRELRGLLLVAFMMAALVFTERRSH